MVKPVAISLFFIVFLCNNLIFSDISAAAPSPAQRLYQKTATKIARLSKDKKKRRYRHLWENCLDGLDRIIDKYPGSPYADKALLKKAATCETLYKYSRAAADLDNAIETYEQYIARYPKSKDVKTAKASLTRLTGVKPETPSKTVTRKPAPAPRGAGPDEAAKTRVEPTAKKDADSDDGTTLIKGIRHWSNADYTRVVLDLEQKVQYKASRLKKPERLCFDIADARVESPVKDAPVGVKDGIIGSVRASQHKKDSVRVVMDLLNPADYTVLQLSNPPRLVIDITGKVSDRKVSKKKRHGRLITLRPTFKKGTAEPLEADAQAGQGTAEQAASDAELTPPTDEESLEDIQEEEPADAEDDTGAGPESDAAPAAAPEKAAAETAIAPEAAPSKKAIPAAVAKSFSVQTIVIDPGHGGKDTGAIGKNGLLEKDVVLDIGLRLRDIVRKELGCKVVMTRDKDVFIELNNRPEIAKNCVADLFISVHANASVDRRAKGIETYLLNTTKDRNIMELAARENMMTLDKMSDLFVILKDLALDSKREESLRLAYVVQANLVKDIQKANGSLNNKGVKQGPFLVLYGADMPSILTEVGFISNPDEEELLASPSYRQKLAQAIYDGIKDFISNKKITALNPSH